MRKHKRNSLKPKGRVRSVYLSDADWESFTQLARDCGCVASRGPNRDASVSALLTKLIKSSKIKGNVRCILSESHNNDVGGDIYVVTLPEPVTKIPAKIYNRANTVYASFPVKFNPFNEVVKQCRFEWEPGKLRWKRTLDPEFNGTPSDRASELGLMLLRNGVPVSFSERPIMDKALSADYKPEHTKWIKYNDKGFAISWAWGEDYYEIAKSMTGSKYIKPYVWIPEEFFEEVVDFSEENNFHWGVVAQEKLNFLRKMRDGEITFVASDLPEPHEEKHKSSGNIPKLKIPENVEIDEEFIE